MIERARRVVREYWSTHSSELVTQLGLQLIVGVLVGLGVGAWLLAWQTTIEERREEQAQALDAVQAERTEMLADVAYVRETLRGGGPKAFLNLNLRNANLAGLDLGCDLAGVDEETGRFVSEGEVIRRNYADQGDGLFHERSGYGPTEYDTRYLCADFSGSDLSAAFLGDGVPCPQVEDSFVVGLRVDTTGCDFGPGAVGCASPEDLCDSDADHERWWDSEFTGFRNNYYPHMTRDAADAHWDWWTDYYEPDGYDAPEAEAAEQDQEQD